MLELVREEEDSVTQPTRVRLRSAELMEQALEYARARQGISRRLGVAMPVHAHLADLAVLGLAEDGAAGIHPLARAAAPVGAAELGGEPRPGRMDLAGLERDLRLVQRDVLPVRPDSVGPGGALAERRAEEHGEIGRASCRERGERQG